MAEGLQIAAIGEDRPDTTVRPDVVNVRCPDTHQVRETFSLSPGSTFAAKWLPEQLIRAKIVHPDRQTVPAVPCSSFCAASLTILRPMLIAIPGSRQLLAPGLSTRTKRFQRHATPPRKTKKPEPITASCDKGLRLKAQAQGWARYSRLPPGCTVCRAPEDF